MPDVSSFTALARAEFQAGMLIAGDTPFPANFDLFTTRIGSTVKVETHTYMSNLPRLTEFNRSNAAVRLENKEYTVANKEYRCGPIAVRSTDIDDDQTQGYLKTINAMPGRAQKDIGHIVCAHLAAGTTKLCFDGSAFFADSHTFGSGDNLDTANMASNDAVTHKIVALITDNSAIKPVLFQDREALSSLKTDADTPQADLAKDYQYWADARFGLGYGFWWDAIHLTITDTPTVVECISTLIPQIINRFRTFTLPKGKLSDDTLYVHEGWLPSQTSLSLLCNLSLAEVLGTAVLSKEYPSGGSAIINPYYQKATVVPTSALGA